MSACVTVVIADADGWWKCVFRAARKCVPINGDPFLWKCAPLRDGLHNKERVFVMVFVCWLRARFLQTASTTMSHGTAFPKVSSSRLRAHSHQTLATWFIIQRDSFEQPRWCVPLIAHMKRQWLPQQTERSCVDQNHGPSMLAIDAVQTRQHSSALAISLNGIKLSTKLAWLGNKKCKLYYNAQHARKLIIESHATRRFQCPTIKIRGWYTRLRMREKRFGRGWLGWQSLRVVCAARRGDLIPLIPVAHQSANILI